MDENLRRRLEQTAGIAVVALLVIGCLVVLQPFVSSILWAAILAYATWPIHGRLTDWLKGRVALAAGVMTLLLALALVLPLVLMVIGLADNASVLIGHVRRALDGGLPGLPEWVGQLPWIGGAITEQWRVWTEGGGSLAADIRAFLDSPEFRNRVLDIGRALGGGALHIALSVIICFFFYRDGPKAAEQFQAVAERIVGDSAQRLIRVAADTITRVVDGVLGTALAQALLAAVGFWMAGVPGALLLGVLTFFASLIPMGPPLIWVPAALWLYASGATGWAIFMAIWGFFVISSVDNIIKPYLISRGGQLPLLLVFLGVVGGVLAFGFIGLFIGPVLLAVAYSLLFEWLAPGAGRQRS
jgi:predicted PurR-regulated permease PerM